MLLLDNIESWIGLMVILSEDHVVVVIYPSINFTAFRLMSIEK